MCAGRSEREEQGPAGVRVSGGSGERQSTASQRVETHFTSCASTVCVCNRYCLLTFIETPHFHLPLYSIISHVLGDQNHPILPLLLPLPLSLSLP